MHVKKLCESFKMDLLRNLREFYLCVLVFIMGVDTRGALGAEAPPPPQIFRFYIIHYIIGMAKIIGLRPKHKVMIVT